MLNKDKIIENRDFKDLSSKFSNADKSGVKNKIKSSDIIEDKDGNCTINGNKIEANACSMLKEDYRI